MEDLEKEKKFQDISKESTTLIDEHKHTVYNQFEKYCLVLLASSIGIWSSFGSPIYYPALQILQKHFTISEELVNISVVVYMICQGLSPSIFGGLSDRFGRRPLLLFSLVVFIGASVGIAVSNNYALLLVLRCIQSSAISPSVAISAGIAGDFTERHERGWFVGLVTGLTLIGQAIGALIGACLIASFNWRAIFWFLAIGGLAVLVINGILLPETKRTLVGNGSVKPKAILNIAPILALPYYRKKWNLDNPDYESISSLTSLDYLAPFKILLRPEIDICLFNGAIHYTIWVVMLTCLTSQLSKNYGYSVMKIGLCYLPAGIGGLFGSLMSGRILDWFYRISYKKYILQKESGVLPKDTAFNIVSARVLVALPFTLITDGFSLMYGWCLYKRAHIATILVSEFMVCIGSMAIVGINTTLLVDLYPSNSSAASSCVNLTRCLMGALFVAVLSTMVKSLNIGGTFTLISGIGFISTGLLVIPAKYGMKWTAEREKKA